MLGVQFQINEGYIIISYTFFDGNVNIYKRVGILNSNTSNMFNDEGLLEHIREDYNKWVNDYHSNGSVTKYKQFSEVWDWEIVY